MWHSHYIELDSVMPLLRDAFIIQDYEMHVYSAWLDLMLISEVFV